MQLQRWVKNLIVTALLKITNLGLTNCVYLQSQLGRISVMQTKTTVKNR